MIIKITRMMTPMKIMMIRFGTLILAIISMILVVVTLPFSLCYCVKVLVIIIIFALIIISFIIIAIAIIASIFTIIITKPMPAGRA